MKIIKSIFQFFWSIHCIAFFSVLVFISFIIFKIQYFLFKDKYQKQYKDYLFRGIGWAICVSFLVKVKKHYHSKYDKSQSYVVVGNHNTAMDIPLNCYTCPKDINMKFLGKAEAGKIPLLGTLISNLTVLVDRKNTESRKKTFKLMAAEISKGFSIFLYPEGTRNRTSEHLKDYYDGAFRLAIEHQLPMVVCTLLDTKTINPPHKLLSFLPGFTEAHWEKPISTEGMTKDDLTILKEKVNSIMLSRLEA